MGCYAHAVKSAEAVAAVDASGLSFACHTAPLCPRNVPILLSIYQYKVQSPGKRVLPVACLAIAEHGVSICFRVNKWFLRCRWLITTYPCTRRSCSKRLPFRAARSLDVERAWSGRDRSEGHIAAGFQKSSRRSGSSSRAGAGYVSLRKGVSKGDRTLELVGSSRGRV